MDLSKLKKKLAVNLGKYKYVLLILCIGLVFILIPTGSEKRTAPTTSSQACEINYISQADLAAILSKIEGAGRVEVMLSLETSSEKDYQLNRDESISASQRITTVTVTDAQRNEAGLVSKTNAPVYRGAIVVCDGADNPEVHLSVVDAVSNITGLRSNQISVVKMK